PDLDALFNHTAVALDRSADHWPVAVLPCAALRRPRYQHSHSGSSDARDLQQARTSQQPDMARSKPSPSAQECCSGCRDPALLCDSVTIGNCFDNLDASLAIESSQLERDNSVGPGWQNISSGYCHQWQP